MEREFDIEIKEVLSRVETVKAESLDDAIRQWICIIQSR